MAERGRSTAFPIPLTSNAQGIHTAVAGVCRANTTRAGWVPGYIPYDLALHVGEDLETCLRYVWAELFPSAFPEDDAGDWTVEVE